RQSRQRNQGVAAPIAEPVIAGDDAAAVRLFWKAAFYDELVGGKDELPKPGGRFFDESLVFRLPVMEQFHFVIRSLRAGGFNIERGCCFRGRHKRNARTGFQLCAEQRGKKAIFAVIKAARSFFPQEAV